MERVSERADKVSKTIKTHYRLTPDESQALTELAERLSIQSGVRITKSDLIRLGIKKLLEEYDEKV